MNRPSATSAVSVAVSGVPANEDATSSACSVFSACRQLLALTLRRQLFSRQTLVGIGLTVLCCLIVLAWDRQKEPTPKKFAEQIVVPIYIAFLMPVLSIGYGASVVGGEREDRTLIYLLITPIPRSWIYVVKYLSANALVAGWAAGTLVAMCLLAGEHGRHALQPFLAASLLGSVAYAGLFLLLGTLFRHGTVISLAYWFFLEVLFGNMPGIIKRVSVAYYVRCIIYDAGSELDLGPRGRVAREMFLPISGHAAIIVLATSIALLLIVGLSVFSRREYRDLS
ncbi:MAG TPA: ABC transporter permease subunit [Planctomycetaceae bacterium]|jgi:ABC-2 type transport system permease protein